MLANLSGIAAFFYAYFWIMRHPLSAATVIPVTWIDDLVPFSLSPSSVRVPVGLCRLGILVHQGRTGAGCLAAACFSMIIVGLGIFMALRRRSRISRSTGPVPVARISQGGRRFRECIAVLACRFAVFTAVVLHGQLTAVRAPRAALACSVLWCLGIVYSAMATRQHLALDIIAGAVLAGRCRSPTWP